MARPLSLLLSLLVTTSALAGDAPRREWKIGETTREALLYAPPSATEKPAPLVFTFHGHGGNMQYAAKGWAIHRHWPEAICVYMQGLPTPGKLTDPQGKKNGWQFEVGGQGDRDFKFFDAVLATVRKEYKIDEKRIYSTGHSNGGHFTYLLWATRGDLFAAVAPSGAAAPGLLKDLKPKPCLHIAGEMDPLVKFEWQRMTIDAVRKLNGCDAEGKRDGKVIVYPSKTGTPLATYLYPGGHMAPTDSPEIVVAFFKQHAKE